MNGMTKYPDITACKRSPEGLDTFSVDMTGELPAFQFGAMASRSHFSLMSLAAQLRFWGFKPESVTTYVTLPHSGMDHLEDRILQRAEPIARFKLNGSQFLFYISCSRAYLRNAAGERPHRSGRARAVAGAEPTMVSGTLIGCAALLALQRIRDGTLSKCGEADGMRPSRLHASRWWQRSLV
jgi:hypothetical protein